MSDLTLGLGLFVVSKGPLVLSGLGCVHQGFPPPLPGGLLPADRTEVLSAGGQPAGLTQGLVSRASDG